MGASRLREVIMTPLRSAACIGSLAALLAACAVRLDNQAPAAQLARESAPPGSAYDGWRLYNQRCAACHGKDAAGAAPMPDLLDRVSQMGPRRFASLVLTRYDWSQAVAEDEGVGPIPRLYLGKTPQGGTRVLEMPAWADEPAVVGHVSDLYAYLAARADGRLGTGSPPR
jgi:mono/diheme cytochrome c family protein